MGTLVSNYINGELKDTIKDDSFCLENPATGEVINPGFSSPLEDVEAALAASWKIFDSGYSATASAERAAYVDRMADYLDGVVDDIAETEALATGVPIRQTKPLAKVVPFAFRKAAEYARRFDKDGEVDGPASRVKLLYRAWGPALCLTPWNSPTPLAAHKVASALAAGAPVILKPSELVPAGPQWIAKAAMAADIPHGLLQLLNGDSKIGAHLVKDVRIKSISFTGGLEAGQRIGAEALQRMCPVQFELGGHNPMVVAQGADLDQAAHDLLLGLTTINGQWCRAVGRLMVEGSVWPELKAKVLSVAKDLVIGNPLASETEMGPLVHSRHLRKLEAQIKERVSLGARALSLVDIGQISGSYMPPTLLEMVPRSMDVEEIFGPVASVHTFSSLDAALELIHEAPHGLAAYVFGKAGSDIEKFADKIRAGSVKLNGVSLKSLNADAPGSCWGVSGLGEEGISETYRFFQGVRTLGYTR